MSKRGDNIHKRKDGRWEGRYIIGRDTNGKAKYASVYAKTYAQAKEKLTLAMVHKEYPVFQSVLFADVLRLWLNDKKIAVKKATYTKYEFLIKKHIIPAFGSKEVNKISAAEINGFLYDLLTGNDTQKKLSGSYVRTIAVILSGAYQYGVNEGMCEKLKNPIFKPSIEKKDVSVLNEFEYKKLIRFLCASNESDTVHLCVLITLFTGLRIGEICALKWDDIDTENSIIKVNSTVSRNGNTYIIGTPKTHSSYRSIPINHILLNQLKCYRKAGTYVLTESDTFMLPRTFENHYKKLLHQAQIREVNFHALRHSFATRCVESGMDIKSLSEILGHANSSITLNTYVHSSMEQKTKQINKVFQ